MKEFYTSYKGPIAAILLFVLIGGIFSLINIQSGLFPDITFPKIKIIAEAGEQPVDKMMVSVTVPLENSIKKVQNLMLLRSTTSRGSCEISAFMDWNSDVDLGKQRIESQINAIKQDLPQGISITVEKMNPSILPVMGYSLEGTGKSQIELRQIAEYTVKPFLSRIEGVSEVAITGGKTKEYHIMLDPVRMSSLGITPQAVSAAISESNLLTSNGYISDYSRLYLSITNTSVKNKEDLENLIIKNTPQRAVQIKDIASVEAAEKKEYVKINANGKDVPLIAVLKQPNTNLINVAGEVQRQVKKLSTILPKGVELKPYYNQADFVNDSIRSLRDVLWVGLLLAIIVTVIFLRSVKASSVVLITIPVTLSLTIIVLYAAGYTFNIMTIGAIAAAVGLIIDDAIVVVEQIHRTHEEHPSESSFKLVNAAVKYLFPAMVGSSLSTIVIFLPFVLMSGVAGAYFKVMTNTMIITLVCSFFVTWIGLPVIYILFSKQTHKVSAKGHDVKQRMWVEYFIKRPLIAGAFSVLLIVVTVTILPKLPSGFLPEMDEGSLVLDFDTPPGTSLEESDRMLRKVDDILKHEPDIESFSRRLGTQMGFFITEPSRGDYLIQLKKDRKKSTMDVADVIRGQIESTLPALKVDFGQVIGDMLGDLMSSTQPIEVKIYGDNQEVLKNLAVKAAGIIEKVPGTADVFNGITIAGPEMIVEPDIPKLAQFNMSPADLQYEVQNMIEGSVAGNILESNKLTDIRIFESQGKPLSINALAGEPVFLPNGTSKPLSEFAKVKLLKGVAEIERENLKPMIAVTGRLNNRDLGSTLKEIQQKISSGLSLPAGYNIEYGGAYAEQQKAFNELLMILVTSCFLVFVVILFLFRNIKVSLLIIAIAALGTSGSILALFLTGTPLNVGSYTGMIMIVGIIGENSIFTYLQYKAEREKTGVDGSIIYSISTRLRPKLMTAFGAIAALFPLALGIGTGAQMHQPLAIAIIGGLIIAMPLLLIVLPTFLRVIEKE
ncbi:MAG TPA: efflux RND transporter permease subunit [Ignavibacteriales bacterium]|nr:efflux RND transporter permease subunit [Ignavibacteriales bacterium]